MQRSILGLYASWSTNFDSKNICDKTVFSVISNSVILANFTAKWSAKSFTCRWKQSIRGKEHINIRLWCSFLVNLKTKTHTLYSLHNEKVLKKNSKIVIFQVYIGLIFCLFYVLFRMFNLFFFYNSCLWFQFH